MASNIVFLKDEKLRQLAEAIRLQEVRSLYHITFASSGDRVAYLRACNENMATVNTILDESNLFVERYKDDNVKGPIADQILVYAEHCLNSALQLFGCYTLRKDYLEKVIDHHEQLFAALEELDTSKADDVAELTESIKELDQMVTNYMRLSLSPEASRAFSRYLRNSNIGFDDLVRSYQTQLGFTGRFDDLEDEEKLAVYAAILERSGRLSVLANQEGDVVTVSAISYGRVSGGKLEIPKGLKTFGSAAMFLFDVGSIVWDVVQADQPITTAFREAFVLAAKMGGAKVGELVGVAVAMKLTGKAATSLFVMGAGLAVGFVGGFIFALAAGAIFGLIIASGGSAPLPTDDLIVYVAPMPNGNLIARQIYSTP